MIAINFKALCSVRTGIKGTCNCKTNNNPIVFDTSNAVFPLYCKLSGITDLKVPTCDPTKFLDSNLAMECGVSNTAHKLGNEAKLDERAVRIRAVNWGFEYLLHVT